jgi:hypothetical protein
VNGKNMKNPEVFFINEKLTSINFPEMFSETRFSENQSTNRRPQIPSEGSRFPR